MALTVKQLGLGAVRSGSYGTPTTNTLYTPAAGKSAVVSNVSFTNPTVTTCNLEVYVLPAAGTKYHVGWYQGLAQNQSFAITDDITLAAGERLMADTQTNDSKVDFVVSGVERDV